MGGKQRDYGIPGTPIFDGTMAQKGYALNAMCYSFNSAENRAAFKADAGGNIYYLAKFAGIFGLDVQDVGAQQTGMTKDAFKAMLLEAGR